MRSFRQYVLLATYIILLSMAFLNINWLSEQMSIMMTALNPIRNAIITAYLLNFMMSGLERYPLRAMATYSLRTKRWQRPVAIGLSYIITVAVVYGLVAVTIPELTTSFTLLMNRAPQLVSSLQQTVNQLMAELQLNDSLWLEIQRSVMSYLNQLPQFISESVTYFLSITGNIASSFATIIFDVGLGLIISVYFLAGKEQIGHQLSRIVVALLPDNWAKRLTYVSNLTVQSFNNYVYGRLLESLIVFSLTFFGMLVLQLPYAALISVIVTITNLIPYAGPVLGAVPSFFLIVVIDLRQAVLFLLLDIVVQQLEGNIIGPQIFSNALGLPGLWVIISLAIGGGLFGLFGLLIAAPVMTVIYALFTEYIDGRYRERMLAKGLPLPPPQEDSAEDVAGSQEADEPCAGNTEEARCEDERASHGSVSSNDVPKDINSQ